MKQQPRINRQQHQGKSSQREDHLNFAHRDFSFINFDDDREFDFSRIKPRLRLVISNSVPVKA